MAYETVSDHLGKAEPLSQRWLNEYEESARHTGEKLFLVLTERPIGFEVVKT